jgi:hypothetical protein
MTMASVRVEWINLAVGMLHDGGAANVVKDVAGTATKLAVTSTATLAGSRPVAPAGARYARVSGVEGNSIVAWGADPTAAQDNGILVAEGQVEAIPVVAGQKLSFVELT